MTKHLPYDFSRCLGESCDKATECLRYYQNVDCGPMTPYVTRYCDTGQENFIPLEELSE